MSAARVRCVRPQGGADGVVRVWDVADGVFKAERVQTQFAIGATFQKESPSVRLQGRRCCSLLLAARKGGGA